MRENTVQYMHGDGEGGAEEEGQEGGVREGGREAREVKEGRKEGRVGSFEQENGLLEMCFVGSRHRVITISSHKESSS